MITRTLVRVLLLFAPSLLCLLLVEEPLLAIFFSLIGSIYVALLAHTQWFREARDKTSPTLRLLRPESIFHLIFIAANVVGGTAYALNSTGYVAQSPELIGTVSDLQIIAQAQALLLLSQASVTLGMQVVRFDYGPPRYTIKTIPPFALTVISILCFIAGTLLALCGSFAQLGEKLGVIGTTALTVEAAIAFRQGRRKNLLIALGLLSINILQHSVSGWKGPILWIAINLGALFYPIMPKRVIAGTIAFVCFWALYFYPFGLALRPLIWYDGIDRPTAIRLSVNKSWDMSMNERLDGAWEMLVGRASEMSQFTTYIDFVPRRRPFYYFDILSGAASALVPRAIWPEKPDLEEVSMRRVYEAGIVEPGSEISAKSNLYQDAYLSFGRIGVVVICLLFGMLIMFTSKVCERLFGGYSIGTCLVFTSLFGWIAAQPPNLEYLFSGIAISVTMIATLFAAGRMTKWILRASPVNGG